MTYIEFLEQVVVGGIAGAQHDYGPGSEKARGAESGFNACRGKNGSDLLKLLFEANKEANVAFQMHAEDYWYWRCRAAEIEYVCNCVSAMLVNEGQAPLIPPTHRGMARCAEILGVSNGG